MSIDLCSLILNSRKTYNDQNPILFDDKSLIKLEDILLMNIDFIQNIKNPTIIAIIGDFDSFSIACTLKLLSMGNIVVPLTEDTESQHDYFLKESQAKFLIKNKTLHRVEKSEQILNPHSQQLLKLKKGGIVFFSTGTTGKPKAILHSLENFLKPYSIRKKPHRSIGFLVFDHIGGFNTLFHLLFNSGTIYRTKTRGIDEILAIIKKHKLTLLPTTPTFLRLLICHPLFPKNIPECLKVISYGTEIMHKSTLEILTKKLPNITLKQTYGMSEIGILPVKSKASDSTQITIQRDENIDWRIEKDSTLSIKSNLSMVCYLNADSPFDEKGWLNTGDIVSTTDNFYFEIIGRKKNFINVGGLKVLPSEIENIANNYNGILRSKAEGIFNPITGEYIKLTIEPIEKVIIDINNFKSYLSQKLPKSKLPSQIKISSIKLSHRMKQS